MNFKDKKLWIIIGGIILLVLTIFLYDAWRKSSLQKELSHIEEQIASKEREIEELEKLSPEERAKREKEQEILSAKIVSEDIAVQGVEIAALGDKKIIKNNAEGYSLELPLNLLIARSISSDWIEIHDKELMCEGDPLCNPVIRIVAEEEKANASTYFSGQKITINGQNFYKVTESIPPLFDGYYYYWNKGTKVFYLRISKFNEELYGPYLNTLKIF